MKLSFKIFVDQRAKWIDGIRAIMLFPVDMAFLSFSYGAATLAHHQASSNESIDARGIMAIVIGGVVCALIATKAGRETDNAMDQENFFLATVISATGWGIAIFVLYWALHAGEIV